MSNRTPLTEAEVREKLGALPHWILDSGKLHREYVFRDFQQAFEFMTQVAVCAEEFNHHPEWFNVWNRVVIDLCTHSPAGITKLDFLLAEAAERIATEMR